MKALAVIPARVGSEGIPGKNFKPLRGISPLRRAVLTCLDADLEVMVTTDFKPPYGTDFDGAHRIIQRPAYLCALNTDMRDVLRHALANEPTSARPILLVQPTQPLRTPAHLRAALTLLQAPMTDSVVSVTQLPLTHHPEWQLTIDPDGRMRRLAGAGFAFRSARQALKPTFIRDGTVYAFWQTTLTHTGTIYGAHVRPLVIPAGETCALDTPADWEEAERRLAALSHLP